MRASRAAAIGIPTPSERTPPHRHAPPRAPTAALPLQGLCPVPPPLSLPYLLWRLLYKLCRCGGASWVLRRVRTAASTSHKGRLEAPGGCRGPQSKAFLTA